MKYLKNILISSILVIGAMWVSPVARAVETERNNQNTIRQKESEKSETERENTQQSSPQESKSKSIEKRDAIVEKIKEENKERKEQKLDDAKKKICEQKSNGIKTSMEKISQVGQKHGEWLTAVVEKINNFITKNNLTVTNYSTLVANIDSAKAELDASRQALETYKTQFDCSGDPKNTVSDFKTAFQTMKENGKKYKEAVKALLDATREAAKSAGITPIEKNNSTNKTGGSN